MIRTSIMKVIMWAIIPIALTLVFFATVDYEKRGNWICLIFIWLAYFTVSLTCMSKWGNKLSVLNWTLYFCAFGYFVVELVVAVLFLYVYSDFSQWSFAIQLLVFVAYILVFGSTYISNHRTEKQMKEFYISDSRVEQWRTKVALMQLNNPSEDLKELSDLLSTTPIMGTQEISSLDDEISTMIDNCGNDTAHLINKIRERNLLLKANN